jgi:hypothetical protein
MTCTEFKYAAGGLGTTAKLMATEQSSHSFKTLDDCTYSVSSSLMEAKI